jgi:hypothetical protein
MTELRSNIQARSNDSFLRKLFLMTSVLFIVYLILGIIGFFLWFAFPVEIINGLTYLMGNNLIYYYIIVNFIDIAGILFISHLVYYKNVQTTTPIKDGVFLGLYLVVMSWLIDLFVYVFIRKTLPSIHEYFFGKNQPEIGIAWIIALISAICSGWLHVENKNLIPKVIRRKCLITLSLLTIISTIVTIIGILFFDIKP